MSGNHSYAEVASLLSGMYGIGAERQTALRGRIQHLQKLGFPKGVNTGRGHKASYGPEQLLLLTLAFELAQLGLSPERSVGMLVEGQELVIAECKKAIRELPDKYSEEESRFLLVEPNTLYGLKTEGEPTRGIDVGSLKDIASRLRSTPSIAIISIHQLVSTVIDARWHQSEHRKLWKVAKELTDWAEDAGRS